MTQREIDYDIYNLIDLCYIHGWVRPILDHERLDINILDKYWININQLKGILWKSTLTPYIINNFVNEFVKIIKPQTMLDPSIGLWFTMREVSEILERKVSIDWLEINIDACEIWRILSKDSPINYIEWDAISILKNLDKKYDFIFWDIPWWMRIPWIHWDWEFEIFRLALDHLNKWWYAIFTNPDKFFFREDSKDFLNNKNYSLVWTIRIPAGSYRWTAVASNLLIFKKGKTNNVFLWNLNEENAWILAKNFFEWKWNSDSRYLDSNNVESYIWEKQLRYESINKQIKSWAIKQIQWFKINFYKDVNLEISNCIYIDTMLKHEVYTASQLDQISETFEKYPNRYLQVILPEWYNTEIFSAFYNSKSNKKLLDIYWMWVTPIWLNNRIYSRTIKDIKLYYPNIDEKKTISVINKLNDLKNIITSLNSDLDSDFVLNMDWIDSRLNKIQLLDEDELLFYNFPTSIRKQYQFYKNQFTAGHYNQAFDFIDHMFLSCSILCISIFRWWLIANDELLNKYKQKLVDSVQRFHVLWFWDIVYLYFAFIDVFKEILNDKDECELISSIYGTDNLFMIESLLDKKIPSLIRDFSNFRNDSAHPWATTEDVYRSLIEEKAEPLLKSFISKISVLKNLSIFICWDWYYDDNDDFVSTLTLFRWDNPKVIKEIVNWRPKKNRLYFKITEYGNAIPMPWLVEYDKILVSDVEKSSYFYSKRENREKKIQYHTYECIETWKKLKGIEEVKMDPLFEEMLGKSEK